MKKKYFLEIIIALILLLLLGSSLFFVAKKMHNLMIRKEATDLFNESMNIIGYAAVEIKLFKSIKKHYPESIKDVSKNNVLERYDIELKNKDNKYELTLNRDMSEEVREYYCKFIEDEIYYGSSGYFLESCIPLRIEIIKEV